MHPSMHHIHHGGCACNSVFLCYVSLWILTPPLPPSPSPSPTRGTPLAASGYKGFLCDLTAHTSPFVAPQGLTHQSCGIRSCCVQHRCCPCSLISPSSTWCNVGFAVLYPCAVLCSQSLNSVSAHPPPPLPLPAPTPPPHQRPPFLQPRLVCWLAQANRASCQGWQGQSQRASTATLQG